jgi:hypothetical protein
VDCAVARSLHLCAGNTQEAAANMNARGAESSRRDPREKRVNKGAHTRQ